MTPPRIGGRSSRGPVDCVAVETALLLAFRIGVWRTARGSSALRVTGGLLLAAAFTGGRVGPQALVLTVSSVT